MLDIEDRPLYELFGIEFEGLQAAVFDGSALFGVRFVMMC